MKRWTTILILLLAAGLLLAGCSPAAPVDPPEEPPAGNGEEPPAEPAVTELDVPVYFGNANADGVVAEIRTVRYEEGATEEEILLLVLDELLAGPQEDALFPGIPAGVRVLGVTVDDGLATVDFSEEMELNFGGGSAGELIILSVLANTLTELDFVDLVMPLVEGDTLFLGHVIIEEPLTRDEDMIVS